MIRYPVSLIVLLRVVSPLLPPIRGLFPHPRIHTRITGRATPGPQGNGACPLCPHPTATRVTTVMECISIGHDRMTAVHPVCYLSYRFPSRHLKRYAYPDLERPPWVREKS